MTTSLEKLAEAVAEVCKREHLTLTTAESCTGGGLSYWLTSIPGSSHWFDRGFVTYSNAAKIDMLHVNPKTLEIFGAVSKETVCEMAEGALRNSCANVSIAITGIAGPTGGSPQKPIGTVFIAIAKQGRPTQTWHDLFPGDRQAVRTSAIAKALLQLLAVR